MSRELVILWAGRHQRHGWDELCGDYRRRIERFMPVKEIAVKVRETGDTGERQRAEARALEVAMPKPGWMIALDRQGEMLSSEALAERLVRLKREWPHPVVFVLGSDLGLSPEFCDHARLVWSFGPLTLPHELARLVLYEQLYRALCIDAGINYHRRQFSP